MQQQPSTPASPAQAPKLQQKLLSIFQGSLSTALTSSTFHATLQQVKSALFNRDFDTAFGSETFLETYAARWSPTRALCYAAVLDGIASHIHDMCGVVIEENPASENDASDDEDEGKDDEEKSLAKDPLRILAIGGAAAELVAFATFLAQHPTTTPTEGNVLTLVDMAPWGGVVEKLREGLTTPPPISQYASAAAKRANTPLLDDPERLRGVEFKQADVLALDRDGIAGLVGSEEEPVLVTLLFTLNELFTAGGVGKTTAFLLGLTAGLAEGSLLLVIDSPGSYSEATVGKEAKKYPMQWLLDTILLRKVDGVAQWAKVEEETSVWFRLGHGMRYPIPLEDMRYQVHLYRRIDGIEEQEDDLEEEE